MRNKIQETVLDYCVDTLLAEDITTESKLRDIGMDSLDIAELSVEVERKLHVSNVKIELYITSETTLNDLIDYFHGQLEIGDSPKQ